MRSFIKKVASSFWGDETNLSINSVVLLGTFAFCLVYSWIWKKVSISAFKVLRKIISR